MALTEYRLIDVLQTYLHTRIWFREQQANEVDRMAEQVSFDAVLRGIKPQDVRKLVTPLTERAARLREPEWVDATPIEEKAGLTTAQQGFMRIGRAESLRESLLDG